MFKLLQTLLLSFLVSTGSSRSRSGKSKKTKKGSCPTLADLDHDGEFLTGSWKGCFMRLSRVEMNFTMTDNNTLVFGDPQFLPPTARAITASRLSKQKGLATSFRPVGDPVAGAYSGNLAWLEVESFEPFEPPVRVVDDIEVFGLWDAKSESITLSAADLIGNNDGAHNELNCEKFTGDGYEGKALRCHLRMNFDNEESWIKHQLDSSGLRGTRWFAVESFTYFVPVGDECPCEYSY